MAEKPEVTAAREALETYKQAEAAFSEASAQGGDCSAQDQAQIDQLAADRDAAWDAWESAFRASGPQAEIS